MAITLVRDHDHSQLLFPFSATYGTEYYYVVELEFLDVLSVTRQPDPTKLLYHCIFFSFFYHCRTRSL